MPMNNNRPVYLLPASTELLDQAMVIGPQMMRASSIKFVNGRMVDHPDAIRQTPFPMRPRSDISVATDQWRYLPLALA
jgi:hypothetical protein